MRMPKAGRGIFLGLGCDIGELRRAKKAPKILALPRATLGHMPVKLTALRRLLFPCRGYSPRVVCSGDAARAKLLAGDIVLGRTLGLIVFRGIIHRKVPC